MRDLLFVVVLLAALAGVGWFLLPRLGGGMHIMGSSQTATQATVPKEPETPEPAKLQKHSSKVRVSAAVVNAAVEVPETKTFVNVPIGEEPRGPIRTYLSPSELKRGLDRAEVNRLFPSPDLRATTVNRGSVFEMYVYVQKPEGQTFIATLRDGKVEQVKYSPQ